MMLRDLDTKLASQDFFCSLLHYTQMVYFSEVLRLLYEGHMIVIDAIVLHNLEL